MKEGIYMSFSYTYTGIREMHVNILESEVTINKSLDGEKTAKE